MPKFEKLLESCRIAQMALKNRIVMAPMGTMYASEDGYVTERLKAYYEQRAKGGLGLVIVETTCIDAPVGKVGIRRLLIDQDKYIPGLSQLADAIHKHGAKVALQVNHAGGHAKSSITHTQPVAPSAIVIKGHETPRELTAEEIEDIITHFAEAAQRAQKAGFDGVEFLAAHGYLLSEFLSQAWNRRRDAFGGSLEKRARILVEVIARTKGLVGQGYPVWCRIDGTEYGIEGGITIDEAQEVARMAEAAGSDAIHVSAYGYGPYTGINRACMGHPRGNLIDLAAAIKKVVNVPVIAVGHIDLVFGEKFLQEKKADLIAIGRPLIADPHLVRKAVEGRFDDIRPCIACNECIDALIAQRATDLRCSVNASVGKEQECPITPAEKTKRVLVVGGGPAGMETARVAALRGHEVILYEKQFQLGGQLNLATKPPRKDEIQSFTNHLIAQLKKLGIEIKLGREVDGATIEKVKPHVIIVATGATPLIPKIPGIDHGSVITAEDVLSGRTTGDRVVIIGGGQVGCETAEFLVEKGMIVTIIEVLDEVAVGLGISVKVGLINRMADSGVTILTGAKCEEITERGVAIADSKGERHTIEADTIVIATGSKPNTELLRRLEGAVSEIHLVGDCVEPRRILEAISDGYRIGLAV